MQLMSRALVFCCVLHLFAICQMELTSASLSVWFTSGWYGHVIEGPYQKPVGIVRVLMSYFILIRWFV
jgi:hypothetical protein